MAYFDENTQAWAWHCAKCTSTLRATEHDDLDRMIARHRANPTCWYRDPRDLEVVGFYRLDEVDAPPNRASSARPKWNLTEYDKGFLRELFIGAD